MAYLEMTVNGITCLVRAEPPMYQSDVDILGEVTQFTYPIGDGPFRRVIDLGAHAGFFTCWMHAQYPDARYQCVEADASNYALLCQNVPWAVTFHRWVGYDTTPAHLLFADWNTGGHLVFHGEVSPDARPLLALPGRISLETLVAGREVDLLKIDIEGGEYDVLMNCEEATLRHIRRIVGERHGALDYFNERIGARLAPWFTLTHFHHPNPTVEDLGLFLAERKET